MVTGGMGVVGSNLVHQLVALGALVHRGLDVPEYGGNAFNLATREPAPHQHR